jgi:predicted aspartyl protease
MTAPVQGCRPEQAFLAVLACCVGILLGAAMATAQSSVYSWTDEKGTVHFSNAGPPPDGVADVTRRVMPPHVPQNLPAGSSEIPFVILDGDLSRRFVPVVLEGARSRKEVLMLIDTGAQITMIDRELADDLDIEHVQDVQIVGVSGVAPGWVGRLRSLRLGDEEVSQLHIMVGPLPGMRLLGMDVVSALKLTIGQKALERGR